MKTETLPPYKYTSLIASRVNEVLRPLELSVRFEHRRHWTFKPAGFCHIPYSIASGPDYRPQTVVGTESVSIHKGEHDDRSMVAQFALSVLKDVLKHHSQRARIAAQILRSHAGKITELAQALRG